MRTLKYIYILLFAVMCANAMDTGIISFVRKRHGNRDIISKESITHNNNCFDELPLDLHGKIIQDVFNLIVSKDKQLQDHVDLDQAVLECYGLAIPIVLGCKFCHDLSKLQQYCKNEIGGKKFLPHELFFLPLKEQEVFIRMAEHLLFAFGNIRPNDYEIVKKMSPTITKGLWLKINYLDSRFDLLQHIGGYAMIISFTILSGMSLLSLFIDEKISLASSLSTASFAIGVGGLALVFFGWGIAHCNTRGVVEHKFL